jgi:hypothetical protein
MLEGTMKVERTERGFELATWTDRGGEPCELQQSSALDGNRSEPFADIRPGSSFVWLGRPGIGNRMHLDRTQVVELVNRLDAWLKTGSFFFTSERPPHGDRG